MQQHHSYPPNFAAPPAQRSSTARVMLIAAAVTGLLVVLVCGGIGVLLYATFTGGEEVLQDVAVEIRSPDFVAPEETFTIEIVISNLSKKAMVLDSLDPWDEYTQGVLLKSSQPPWRSSMHYPGFTTHDYQATVPPEGELVVTFQAVAIEPGDFRGDIDICINDAVICTSRVLRTIVRESGEQSAAGAGGG